MRGPGGFHGGRVSDALVSQVDRFPIICELAGIPRPEWVRGQSLLGLVRRQTDEVNDAVFAEITFHAAYEPQRAVRTRRYKYIRRFDNGHAGPVLANIDDSPSKDLLVAHGLAGSDAGDRRPADRRRGGARGGHGAQPAGRPLARRPHDRGGARLTAASLASQR
jgi:arylsulfatase A-like enzyme